MAKPVDQISPRVRKSRKLSKPREYEKNPQKAVLYALGGISDSALKSISCYDSETDSWNTSPIEMPFPRTNFGCVSINKDIFVIGGYDNSGFNGNYQGTMFRLDTGSGQWEEYPPIKYPRQGCGVACSEDGKHIYVAGGWIHPIRSSPEIIFSIVERFSLQDRKWTTVKPMSVARSDVQLVELGGYIYALGGSGDSENFIKAERYSPETDQWSQIPPMKHDYGILGAAVLDGKIYVLGPDNSFEMYSPEEDRWTELPEPMQFMPRRRLVAFNGKLLAIGGVSYGLRRRYRYDHDLKLYFEIDTGVGLVDSFDVEKQIWSMEQDMNTGRAFPGVAVVTHDQP